MRMRKTRYASCRRKKLLCDGAGARSPAVDHPCLHVWVFMGITSMNRILWDSQRKDTPNKDYQGHLKHRRIFPPWKGITFGKIIDSNLVQPLSRERQSCLLQAGDCELYVEVLSHMYLPDALRVSGVVRRVPRTGEGSRET